jgi:hypothetical protein
MVEATIEDFVFTGAKPFLKADIKPFGITEIEMLPTGIEVRKKKLG